ncbi:MAG: hypothetical protein HYV35_07305 [Lentisphaerae bacterium]|nr:hypothetical protein [Lentisphaerota bacterium]
MIVLFAIGFFIGTSLLFSGLFGWFRGWTTEVWLSGDYWIVELILLVGSFLLAGQLYTTPTSRQVAILFKERAVAAWLASPRRAFSGGIFSGLVGPLLCGLLIMVILAVYSWFALDSPFAFFNW